ncbi:hypothetical protein [Dactylococcopsis salina]|uniref:Uncharacterized protein n=1 Tax=Dactylococcopsis salina (strain PCC 8305) TaxID=13035 RepID=K9YUY1_DACS8|nr:hypothetical protein [Dactylococcopsis salina]AFZ50322.1 hypothetical protein Dacsa_1655 [Dactylococcopsis salina PCC 8305]
MWEVWRDQVLGEKRNCYSWFNLLWFPPQWLRRIDRDMFISAIDYRIQLLRLEMEQVLQWGVTTTSRDHAMWNIINHNCLGKMARS